MGPLTLWLRARVTIHSPLLTLIPVFVSSRLGEGRQLGLLAFATRTQVSCLLFITLGRIQFYYIVCLVKFNTEIGMLGLYAFWISVGCIYRGQYVLQVRNILKLAFAFRSESKNLLARARKIWCGCCTTIISEHPRQWYSYFYNRICCNVGMKASVIIVIPLWNIIIKVYNISKPLLVYSSLSIGY